MSNISIQGINFNNVSRLNMASAVNKTVPFKGLFKQDTPSVHFAKYYVNNVRTHLGNETEINKYNTLVNLLKSVQPTPTSFNLTPNQQLDALLKNGKLLSKSNNGTTMLDNLYEIITKPRVENLNQINLVCNILDNTSNPRIIPQTLGDIPESELPAIIRVLPDDNPAKKNPSLLNSISSGTCPAASNDVNLADKNPAEYSRWVNELSSPKKAVDLKIRLDSISKNKLDAISILNMLEANMSDFSYDTVKLTVKLDDNALIRAKLQDKYWDLGERNVANVLVQCAIMQAGSQNTYDSLTDTRGGQFNSNPKGLIEVEKTFVESVIKDQEITSLVYQRIDDDQNLLGYTCSFDKMEKHIKDTIDSGNNVIIGYVLTNETVGKVESGLYNPAVDGPVNRVINGHEITIVDYKTDQNGKTVFVCVDTDDDSPEYVEYSAEWLLPKIHHAGYPAHIVAADEREIMQNANLI